MAPRNIDTSKWDDEEYDEYEDIAARFSNIRVGTEPADEDEPGGDSDSGEEQSDEDSGNESASETENDCDPEPASPASSSSGEFTEAVAWHLPRDQPLPRIPPWTGLKYLDKCIKKEWERREAFEKEDRELYREFLREQREKREREEQRWRASLPPPERRDSSGSESSDSECRFCADGTCCDCTGRHSDEECEEEGDGEVWEDQDDDGEECDDEEGDGDGYVWEDEDEEVSEYEG